jgi:glycogen operon protein
MASGRVLGARFAAGGSAVDFTLLAPAATRVELWIFGAPVGGASILRQPMTRQSDGSFEASASVAQLKNSGLTGVIYYGYRAWGPNWPFAPSWAPGSAAGFVSDVDGAGNRFNPNKLLIDPYALEISHDPLMPAQPDPTRYHSGPASRTIDTAPFAPKGIVMELPAADFGTKPSRAFKDEVIYEVHLRGLTRNDPAVPANLRGTYAGAALRANYLRDLGVTAVEFLPIHETQNSLNDAPEFVALHNYWGYDSVSYFAPDRRYASDQSPGGPTREWIQMVKAFHAAGVKVYVDVVYNHYDESKVDQATGAVGEIFSLRGLDNAAYYELLSPSRPNQYQDDNGVGPNVNAANTLVRNLVLDSVKYWSGALGVDGFRFDLAAVLGNANATGGFSFNAGDPNNILNRAAAELPARPAQGGPGVDLIAEPYTAGSSGGQQQGNFPTGWSEWNDRFRDVFRASQNKLGFSTVTPGQMATRFAGSDDLFRARGRRPGNSVNYIVSHDGFTLRDLYSFNGPQNNQPFPFGPSPGGRSAGEEMCWDHNGDPAAQMRAVRTALAILALSAGTPMLTGGSEFARTQFGNNNPFNLDTEANWLDWPAAAPRAALTTFTRLLLAFRRAHPCLRPAEFFTGSDHNGNGLKDLTWLYDAGQEVTQDYFADPDKHFLAYRIDGTEFGDPNRSVYVGYNGWSEPVLAALPPPLAGNWFVVADTGSPAEAWGNIRAPGTEFLVFDNRYLLQGRSVVLLIEG